MTEIAESDYSCISSGIEDDCDYYQNIFINKNVLKSEYGHYDPVTKAKLRKQKEILREI